ncbi:UTRA domain-containing protein [Halalkalibacter sp. MEB205]|uniref:UTRA domain-containing protein n=2 Tax=Halalkalibacter alkaliphilus TaxID=2917993 RepID=A0A9X2CV63_9BACI|nr:UTRA domain-containing protein [Halalkalibacter alkaliphilus]
MGQVIFSKVLRAEFRSDLYHEQSMLNVGDEEILLIERIRFADSVPVALERTCWPKEIGQILMKYDLNEARYYDILEKHNYYLNEASESITAINATIIEADLLSSRPGEAMLQMTRLSYGLNKKPIEYTITKYRSDQYQYDIQLKR